MKLWVSLCNWNFVANVLGCECLKGVFLLSCVRILIIFVCSCQPVSCADVCLESSYEKVGGCVYTSTLLYEYEGFGLNAKQPCFLWKLAYSEVCDYFIGNAVLQYEFRFAKVSFVILNIYM